MTLGHVDFLIWFASDIDIVGWAGPKREIEQGMAGLTIFFLIRSLLNSGISLELGSFSYMHSRHWGREQNE